MRPHDGRAREPSRPASAGSALAARTEIAGGERIVSHGLLTVISGRATLASERLHAGEPAGRDVERLFDAIPEPRFIARVGL